MVLTYDLECSSSYNSFKLRADKCSFKNRARADGHQLRLLQGSYSFVLEFGVVHYRLPSHKREPDSKDFLLDMQ